MQNIYFEIERVLSASSEYVSEGKLLRNKVIESAMKSDQQLLRLLLGDPVTEQYFFKEIDGVKVFDSRKLQLVVNNKQFIPDSYTSYKNRIGLANEQGTLISEMGGVQLIWPYKDCILEGGQTKDDQKKDEVFWNELLAPEQVDRILYPKVLTNIFRYDSDGKLDENPEAFTDKDNLIIKGNNLLAISSLRRRFEGEVKMIYIDPPYNTAGSGDTFSYNNNFKHSTWLTFMENRLRIAKDFLTPDGFIAMAIDHAELFYLGVLADEIFGRENRVGIVTVVHKPEGRNLEKFFATSNEFMIVYAKDKAKANFSNVIIDSAKQAEYDRVDEKGIYKLNNYLRAGGGDDNLRVNKPHFFYPIYVHPVSLAVSIEPKEGYEEVLPITTKGQERTWKTQKDTFIKVLTEGDIIAEIDENGSITINEKYRPEDKGQLIKTHWIDKRYNAINSGTKVLENIIGTKEFSYPKSLYTVQDIINICTKKDDIILDFFAGSGTTAHAVLNLNNEDGGNRRFIIIEQMDYIKNVTVERIKRVITTYDKKASFVYCELKELNQKFFDAITNAISSEELMKIWGNMQDNAYLIYQINNKTINDNVEDFLALEINDQKRFLLDILDKNMLYVNYSEIEDEDHKVTDYEKSFNYKFYERE